MTISDDNAIKAAWAGHVTTCAQCRMYDPLKPSTLAYACLAGSRLIKAMSKAKGKHK